MTSALLTIRLISRRQRLRTDRHTSPAFSSGMDILQELSCNGVPPTGPVSAWPRSRHRQLVATSQAANPRPVHATKVNAGLGKMARGLVGNVGQAIVNGKVSEEIRNERYDTCKNCPFFIEDSKRCSECGCFMEAKTWIGGDPNALCPKKKWSR